MTGHHILGVLALLLLSISYVHSQAMGFESESGGSGLQINPPSNCPGRFSLKKKCKVNVKTATVWFSENLKIKKGDILDVALRARAGLDPATNPTVHATFEFIRRGLYPVEFVSDPFFFGTHDREFCQSVTAFKTKMDNVLAVNQNHERALFHADFTAAVTLKTPAAILDQALQVTYSFPAANCWKAIQGVNRFITSNWNSGYTKKISGFFVNHAVQFLDNHQDNLEDHVKYFVFHMLQFFYNGYLGGSCDAGDYAKLIGDAILPRTNFYQFIRLALGTQSVKAHFQNANNAIQTILRYQREFVVYFNAKVNNFEIDPKVQAGTCTKGVGNRRTHWFAKTYERNKNFPFSVESFIRTLWTDKTGAKPYDVNDLFRKHASIFDKAIGLWVISPTQNPPIVGFEVRMFSGMKYPTPQDAPFSEIVDYKLPTLYNLGKQINDNNFDVDNMDIGFKKCNTRNAIVAYTGNAAPAPVSRWQNAGTKRTALTDSSSSSELSSSNGSIRLRRSSSVSSQRRGSTSSSSSTPNSRRSSLNLSQHSSRPTLRRSSSTSGRNSRSTSLTRSNSSTSRRSSTSE